jgi:hypothetical protein
LAGRLSRIVLSKRVVTFHMALISMDAAGEVVNRGMECIHVFTYATESVLFVSVGAKPLPHWQLEATPLPFFLHFR